MTGNCNKTATSLLIPSQRVMTTRKNALPDTLIIRVRGTWPDGRPRLDSDGSQEAAGAFARVPAQGLSPRKKIRQIRDNTGPFSSGAPGRSGADSDGPPSEQWETEMIPCPGKPDPAEDLIPAELTAEDVEVYRKMVEEAADGMEALWKELGIYAPLRQGTPRASAADAPNCAITRILILYKRQLDICP